MCSRIEERTTLFENGSLQNAPNIYLLHLIEITTPLKGGPSKHRTYRRFV